MSDKITKTPQLRFAGYTDAWKQQDLGKLAEFSKGSGYTKKDLKERGFPVVLYGRLYTNYETIINNVDNFVEIKDKSVISEGNEVVVPTSGESAEEISRASVIGKAGFILGGDLNIIKPKQEVNSIFLALAISNGKQKKEVSKRAQGKSVVHLYNSDLKDIGLLYPAYKEQKQIGNFFVEVDNLITLQKQKLGLLKETKKSLLQKMFPREGADVPEIRFAGFTDAWEQRRLGDYAEILTGGTPKTSVLKYWEPKEIPWMSSGEVHKRRLDETDSMISKEGLNESNARWIKEHSVLIALAGQGKTRGTVAINNIPLTTNQSIAAIVPNEILYYEFIFQNLVKRYDELRRVSSGDGTRGGLNKQIISNVIMPFTNIEEQKKISRFLSNFDNLIILHQRELNALKNLKKSLLHQMFV